MRGRPKGFDRRGGNEDPACVRKDDQNSFPTPTGMFTAQPHWDSPRRRFWPFPVPQNRVALDDNFNTLPFEKSNHAPSRISGDD